MCGWAHKQSMNFSYSTVVCQRMRDCSWSSEELWFPGQRKRWNAAHSSLALCFVKHYFPDISSLYCFLYPGLFVRERLLLPQSQANTEAHTHTWVCVCVGFEWPLIGRQRPDSFCPISCRLRKQWWCVWEGVWNGEREFLHLLRACLSTTEYEDGSLSSWINKERFQGYLQIDGFTLYELGETGKKTSFPLNSSSLVWPPCGSCDLQAPL